MPTLENKRKRWKWAVWAAMAVLLLVALILWQIAPKFEESIIYDDDPSSIKILFIGNSLTFTEHVPAQFVDITKANIDEIKLDVQQVAYPNYTLKDHWFRKRAAAAIESQNWDYVVLQGHSREPIKNPKMLKHYVNLFDEEAQDAHAKTILYATWTDFDKLELHDQIMTVFKNLSKDSNITLAPVGESIYLCLKEHPEIKLLREDKHHATDSGAYLVAATIFSTIFKKPVTIPPDSMFYSQMKISKDEKIKLNDIAKQACLKHSLLKESKN